MRSEKSIRIWHAAILTSAMAVAPSRVAGQCEVDRFEGSTGGSPGWSVDVSGEWAAVGAPTQGTGGAVLMYRRNEAGTPEDPTDDSWSFYSEVSLTNPASGDRFGDAVSINGSYLAVGAKGRDIGRFNEAGAAYTFRFDGTSWQHEGAFEADATFLAAGRGFGWSVAVAKGPATDSPFVAVGSPYESGSGALISDGGVYIYRRNASDGTWSRVDRLSASDATSYINFGFDVAASRGEGIERLVISAPYSNPTQGRGSVYVLENAGNENWQETQKLEPTVTTTKFGRSVSIALSESLGADQIAVAQTSGTGQVYVFAQDASSVWQIEHLIESPPAAKRYGLDVATNGDAVLVSDAAYTEPTFEIGAAHLYLRSGDSWVSEPVYHLLQPDDVEAYDNYGTAVGLDGSFALVSSKVNYSPHHGAVYFYPVGPDADDDGYADACDNCRDVANGRSRRICTEGLVTPCATDEACDTTAGAGDGTCSIPLGICVTGLVSYCDELTGSGDAECDTFVDAGDGVCGPEQADQDTDQPDGIGDVCDNCPTDFNENQGDFNGNGLGDVCDPAWNIADELLPPSDAAYAAVTPDAYAMADVQPPTGAFFHDKVDCVSGTPEACSQWEGRWFVNEAGVITIQWRDSNGVDVGDPVVYVATPTVGAPPDGASYVTSDVDYFLDWYDQGVGVPVMIDTNFDLTIRYNANFLENTPPTVPSDVYVLGGSVQTPTDKEGRIVFQYTDGPGGRLMGFEVVDVRSFGTPAAQAHDVGRQLAIPAGADCKAVLVTNAEQNGFPVAWQRQEAPLEIWPIRPETSASDFVVAWYDTTLFTGNCWHHSIERFVTDWPADPQPFVVVNDAVPDPPVVFLPVGADDTYCTAEVMYPSAFTPPRAQIANGFEFSAGAPGYAVVRFDIKDDLPGATCSNNRTAVLFEVIRAYDHEDAYDEFTDTGVDDGLFTAPIGTQLMHPEHDTNTPAYPFGYLYAGQPHAPGIYQETGQIFPVNSSNVHGTLEVWWFEEGGYASETYWPHRVGTYDAVWPTGPDRDPDIIIASRSGAGAYPEGATIYEIGVFGEPDTLDGWNPNDEHAILLPIAGSLRAFAVRDDNPWGVGSGHPYTLVKFPEKLCSAGANPCLDEAACGAGESCDPNGLYRMGVHHVVAEAGAFDFDYTAFPNQADPSESVPVLAGLPIDPLFPVNFAAAACLDDNTPPAPLTQVLGSALWVDRTGGIWAVEEETDDFNPQPSSATVLLWENWGPDGGCQPWRDFSTGDGSPTPIVYRPSWPPAPPNCTYPTDPGCARPLAPGDRVDQTGQCGTISVLHDSSGIRIIDPTHEVSAPLTSLPAGVDFSTLPPHLVGGELGGGGSAAPDRVRHEFGDAIYFRGIMSQRDRELLLALSQEAAYQSAIFQLYNSSRQQLTFPLADPVEKWVSIGDQGVRPGWVTLAFQNDDACDPLPVSVEVWRVDCPGSTGRIQAIQPTCPFNEKLVLQHTIDGGGRPELLIYQWQWSVDYDPTAPEPATWNDYNPPTGYASGIGLREVIIEGSSPFTLADSWWRARYRGYVNCPCNGQDCNQGDDPWPPTLLNDGTAISDWSEPQLAEGWVKRVVRGINPFDQRLASFHDGPVNTYVDMIGQAGIRFEAPVPLNCTPDNIDALGLIQVYETVLRRARSFSIDVGVSYDPATLALLLASSKISNLYMLLGNEAYADGSDPTLGLFAEVGEQPASYDPHAVFAFENQVPTVLEEELALYRGTDTVRPPDLDLDGRVVATVYNRLPWNFTSGNGQIAYANNYQVTDVTAAQEIYRQGHGDAYGHYLTALKKFYTLLTHPVFEWIVSTESVLVGGQPVQVGFQYERAFAKAAAAKARTGAAVTALTFRQQFDADPASQGGYPDEVDPDRAWGVAEWARRTGQGTYFDWVAANALLDDTDDDPAHANTIQQVDRTTVSEIREIAASFTEIQSTLDKAYNGLNPLGLAANVVPFGLNPSEIESGKTHFEQIMERAIAALGNAVTAFDYANENTRRLRAQQDVVEEFQDLTDERERDFNSRLIELFGKPYPEDVGATGAYPAGYDGPDLLHFEYVEPSDLLGARDGNVVTISTTLQDRYVDPDTGELTATQQQVAFNVSTDGLGLIKPRSWTSTRPELGEIQLARFEILQAIGRIQQALENYEAALDEIERHADLLQSRFALNADTLMLMRTGVDEMIAFQDEIRAARRDQLAARTETTATRNVAGAIAEGLPTAVGLSNDLSSVARSGIRLAGELAAVGFEIVGNAAAIDELRARQDQAIAAAEQQLTLTGWEQTAQAQQQIQALEQLVRRLPAMRLELLTLAEAANQATARYHSAVGRGLRLYDQLIAFRQNTARDVAQFRYRDVAFRIFRNDALQKYRAQFDLCARYAFLAARAYDYETNLLGSDQQAGREFLTDIVKERVLGVVDGNVPLVGNGVAGRLAELNANWSALKPQLGFNSLDEIKRTFSLRWEMFRKPNSVAYDEEWRDILASHRIDDLNALQEYGQYCQPLQPAVPNNPAIVIPIETTVQSALNLFGWPSTGDATLPSDRFAIKLHSHAVRFSGYPGFPLNQQVNVYLVPVGADIMRTPTCPDAPTRQWHLLDQTLPIPFPIGTQDLDTPGWMPWDALDGGSAATARRRLIPTTGACAFGDVNCTDVSFKLTGRSMWNTRWLLIIPGSELLGADPQQGIDVFINGSSSFGNGVRDIKLVINAYGYSGCISNAASEATNADRMDAR